LKSAYLVDTVDSSVLVSDTRSDCHSDKH
jgi:hypothetical protein